MKKFMQCCYTNVGGWKAVAVSDGIPPEAYEACTKLQNVNSSIPAEGWNDEDGNVLNLMEIHGGDSYSYYIRTQYGLRDVENRNNMFSHAYILPWQESGALEDPNVLLAFSKKCFATSMEEAENNVEIEELPPLSIKTAMDLCGLDVEHYIILIQCVYAQMAMLKAPVPLFIQYDGDEAQMRAMLYCIYVGLPYYMRKKLVVASAATNAPERMNIIFSKHAAQHKYFIVPQSGENNILTEKTIKKIERYGYLDHAARNVQKEIQSPGYFLKYFSALEKTASKLGDSSASNELVLKIAYQLMFEEDSSKISDVELESRISDAMRSKSRGNIPMDDYIAELLEDICSRKIVLADGVEELILDRLSVSNSERLADASETYQIGRLYALDVSKAALKLSMLPRSIIDRYESKMVRDRIGNRILEHYYANVVLVDKKHSWELLSEVWSRSRILEQRDTVREKIEVIAWELYQESLEANDAKHGISKYMDIMRKVLPASEIEQCEYVAKEEYWNGLTLMNYSENDSDIYYAMAISVEKCKRFSGYHKLQKCKVADNGDVHVFFDQVDDFFGFHKGITEEERIYAVRKLVERLEKKYPALNKNEPFFERWTQIVSALATTFFQGSLIRRLHESIFDHDYNEICECLRSINLAGERANLSEHEIIRLALNDLGRLVADECLRLDREDECVPLDVWLIVGALWLGKKKCLHIFDRVKPYILSEEPDIVVADSRFFSSAMLELAEDYISNKGQESKTVKKWLSERKKMLHAVDKRPGAGGIGGILSSRFTRGGNGDGTKRRSPFAGKSELNYPEDDEYAESMDSSDSAWEKECRRLEEAPDEIIAKRMRELAEPNHGHAFSSDALDEDDSYEPMPKANKSSLGIRKKRFGWK